MPHGSASDEATIGTYLRMGQPETTDAVRRQLQLLLVGGSEEELASLHELLVGTSNAPYASNTLPPLRTCSISLGKKTIPFYSAVTNRLIRLHFSCYPRCANMFLAFRSFF